METQIAAAEIERWPQSAEEFERLIELTGDELVHYAFYRLGNHQDAEDVVQDVYVAAFRDRRKRARIAQVRPYLFRMVGNRCTDVARRRSRYAMETVEETTVAADRTFPEVAAREQAERLRSLLRELPLAESEVIHLRVLSELSFAEVAAAVGSPVPTVKSRFRYGLAKLRRLLSPEGGCKR
jgi:RNA polymerase sigma-70 factor (ECF subfamily)